MVCIYYVIINLVAWAIYMTVSPHIYRMEGGWWKIFFSSNGKNPLKWVYSVIAIALCGWYLVAESARVIYEFKKLEEKGFSIF